MLMQAERESIVEMCHMLFEKDMMQLNGGNLSIRDTKTELICVTPSGFPYYKMKPEHCVIIDIDGNVVEGDRKPTVETPMHTLLYKTREDFQAIVHCHSPFAVAWSTKFDIVRTVIACQFLNNGPITVAPYQPVGSVKLAQSAVDGIGEDYGTILQCHGIICGGKSMDHAMSIALSIEDAAKISCVAAMIGGHTKYIDKEIALECGKDPYAKLSL